MRCCLFALLVSCVVAAAEAPLLPESYNNRPLCFAPLAEGPADAGAPLQFRDMQTGLPIKLATHAHVYCTHDSIVFEIVMEEPDFENIKKNGHVWQRDSVEFFLFNGEKIGGQQYYQVIVDAQNEVAVHGVRFNPQRPKVVDAIELKNAPVTSVKRTATGWQATITVKFSDVPQNEAKSSKGLWRMALYRNRPARGDLPSQHYAWSPTWCDEQQSPAHFGYLLAEPLSTPEALAAVTDVKRNEPPTDAERTEISQLIEELGDGEYTDRL
jgi:hypothetical protein